MQVVVDALFVFRAAARGVGIVQAEEQRTGVAAAEQEVDQPGAGVADMQIAGGAGRETDFDGGGDHAGGVADYGAGGKFPGLGRRKAPRLSDLLVSHGSR